MKYSVEIEIDLPRDRVIELFDDTENLYKWQEGLLRFEPISGEPGQPGAKSKLAFRMGKRELEMVETITERALPDRFDGTYETKGVYNVVRNRFEALGPDRTRWVSENEFRFSGFMKVIGFLMRGSFPKTSMKYLTNFKAFAEEGRDVRDAG